MTNAILREKTNAGSPQGWFDDVEAASYPPIADRPEEVATRGAKPGCGALLRKGKSFGAMLCIALGAALPVFGAVPTLNSPVNDATLATLKGSTTEEGSHKWFFYGLSAADRKSLMNFELYGPGRGRVRHDCHRYAKQSSAWTIS